MGGASRGRRPRALHAREHGLRGEESRARTSGAGEAPTARSRSGRRRPPRIRRDRDDAGGPTRAGTGPRRARELVAKAEHGCFVFELADREAPASLDRQRPGTRVSTAALDLAAVRARFSALDRRLAFFDGPGGTQCPDEVSTPSRGYLREVNANIGAPYETSRRTTALVELAHERAASFLGCSPEEIAFGRA